MAADWMGRAACKGMDANIFFPTTGEDQGLAFKVCSSCPVRHRCGQYAITRIEDHGVWGGMSERERRRIRQSMRRRGVA